MAKTTIQLDKATHQRLAAVKDDMTFDEVIGLMLDLLDPDEIRLARDAKEKAYQEWQRELAQRIRASGRARRLF